MPNPKNSEATRLQKKDGNRQQSSTVANSKPQANPNSNSNKTKNENPKANPNPNANPNSNPNSNPNPNPSTNANAGDKTALNNNESAENEESDLWRQVKRRSRTSSKEPSGGSTALNAASQVPATSPAQQITNQTAAVVAATSPPSQQHLQSVEKEDLEFQFDEELDIPIGRTNNFTENWSDDESDYELSDRDINKILIVTQVRHRAPKHDGYNRTGDFVSRTKITQDLEQVINDGLHNYEEDLWTHDATPASSSYKTLNIITQEDFEKMAPRVTKKNPDVPPPPPPTYDNDSSTRLNTSTGSGLGSKKARFFAVNKEEFVDPRTPRKRKTRHLYNPPVECHVGWVCCPSPSSR